MQIHMYDATTVAELYGMLVPQYKSKVMTRPFVAYVREWSDVYAEKIREINPERAKKRCDSYLNQKELARVRERLALGKDCSIRFGVAKEGRGYHGERGDFCLVGGAVEGRNLTLFYRSLELIGGLGYDLVLIHELSRALDVRWKSVTICAARANVFALRRNSNEKLYPKLRRIFGYATHQS